MGQNPAELSMKDGNDGGTDHRATVIDLPAGRLRVRHGGGLIRALGIPYAEAGRWQFPQPVERGAIDATNWARGCPQLPIARLDAAIPRAFDRIRFDENCLQLSVTAPQAGRDLPVMVGLHGGSYEAGAGDMGVFDPAALAREQRVVVVSVTYRLGLFGWLSGRDAPANLGAHDVIAALRWVAENIAPLGGDPGQLTLFGQSSGGDLIARLMVAEAAQGLFHRAIIQSAPLALPLRSGRMRAAMRRAASALSADASAAEVLAVQAAVQRAARRFGLAGQMPFGPEFGAPPFPPETALEAAHRAAARRIPLLIGHARDEAALFLPPVPGGLGRLANPLRRAVVGGLTARLYGRPAAGFAARHAGAGGEAMRFVMEWQGGAFGRAHLSELPLLFPHRDWIGSPLVPEQMSVDELTRTGRDLRRVWADFARGRMPQDDLPGVIRFLAPR
ncbi:para-nitrobenzyl esterase [Paracoccus isoporae]|uniref:Para-nitrobenzyl esterase n=1 Tax=Paracoccus isoporae TaxID=591205 RepID=A0A1G7DYY1_9RHOB|nr:carboxylesterase family protein [Paracoccus isoporae]SDE56644.1 para-nitrobenzyl esterase [Paracoccus isoporae]